jgi:hypothetical protein
VKDFATKDDLLELATMSDLGAIRAASLKSNSSYSDLTAATT